MSVNIPKTAAKRVVVVGGGFGGLKLCSTLTKNPNFQVVLIDRNNYHQFPPLIYQIATAGLQVSSISFPFRKIFAKKKNFFFRMCDLRFVDTKTRTIQTSIGKLEYDYLVIATGTTTNYFGNQHIEDESMPMKTLNESLGLRNALLNTFERANTCSNAQERQQLLNFVIVGGGPSGVEIAGALAEMKTHVLPQDYPDLDANLMQIHLLQGGPRLLPAMSQVASDAALKYLKQMGVDVQLNSHVTDYKDNQVFIANGNVVQTRTIIWVCGIKGRRIEGLDPACYGPGNRIKVDRFNQVEGYENIFAVGDIALMQCPAYPHGHPQMAQPAIQQGKNLALNFIRKYEGKPRKAFDYRDLGSMATIGRNKAVADIAGMNLTGFFAWFLWMGVHLMSILGVKNKLSVLLDWAWSYFSYDKSNRILISAKHPKVIVERNYLMSKRHWGELTVDESAKLDADLGLSFIPQEITGDTESAKLAKKALATADAVLATKFAPDSASVSAQPAAPAQTPAAQTSAPQVAEAQAQAPSDQPQQAKVQSGSTAQAVNKVEAKTETEAKSEVKAVVKAETKPENGAKGDVAAKAATKSAPKKAPAKANANTAKTAAKGTESLAKAPASAKKPAPKKTK